MSTRIPIQKAGAGRSFRDKATVRGHNSILTPPQNKMAGLGVSQWGRAQLGHGVGGGRAVVQEPPGWEEACGWSGGKGSEEGVLQTYIHELSPHQADTVSFCISPTVERAGHWYVA